MEEARATRASVFPRETRAVALPAAAEGLVQADRGLQAGQSQLHGGILRRVQRALRFEDRQQGFRAGLVAAVGEIEGALRLLQLLLLPVQLAVEAVDAVQRAFGVGKGGEDRLAVGFQQFFLARQAAVALGAQAAVVEDRGEQVGAQVVIGVAESVGGAVGAGRQLGAQGQLGEQRRARHLHVGLGRGQLRFGVGDIGTAAEQFARQARSGLRPAQAVERSLGHL